MISEGIEWEPLQMNRRSVNPFGEMMVIWRLIRIFNKYRPDLVHNFTIKSVIYGTIAGRLTGVKSIVNAVAGMGFIYSSDNFLARVLRPVITLIFKTTLDSSRSRLILQNPDDLAFFKKQGLVRGDHIRLIKGSGVNADRFIPNTEKSGDVVKVLLASRLLWEKGIKNYVEAARKVTQKYNDVEFLLAGTPDQGNPGSVQNSDIEQWKADNLIKPLGHVDNMPELLRDVHVVVLPTVYGEGVPRILIEAAAAGIPLVATDVPGCREIVNDGINGYLVHPGDSDALGSAIGKLVEDPGRREEMGQKGRQIMLDEFEEKSVLKRTLDVYKEVMI